MHSQIAASISAIAHLRGIGGLADLAALAACAGPFISEAELHGAVCGLVAGRAERPAGGCAGGDVLQELIDLLGSDALADAEGIDAFVQASAEALFAEDMSFQPLLPGDEAPMDERVRAIAEWCGAFAAGYGAAGAPQDEDSEELLGDFVAISSAVVQDEDEDTAEAALLQLEQYVKVGALLLATGARRGADEGHWN